MTEMRARKGGAHIIRLHTRTAWTVWSLAGVLTLAGCERSEPADPAPAPATDLRAVLERLVRGPKVPPSAEDEHSWFSAATAGVLDSVTVDTAGHATVDFQDLRPLIGNASTSAGSALLMEDLNEAVFSVAGIESVEYRMEGSCELFWEWLQYACQTVTREQATGRR
ncbi:MAG: hypothetical protein WEA24_02940 [Gemmatimonadota bacterium]